MPTTKTTTKTTSKTAALKTTIRAIVVRSWSTEGRFGISYFFKLCPVDGTADSSIVSTIPANVIASSPCGEHGRIHSLVGAEVELTGRIDAKRGERHLSNPRGRVVKLTPAMAALLVEEQERDAVVKATWAKGLEVSACTLSPSVDNPVDGEA